MPDFDIVKKSDIDKSARVAIVMGDYDVALDHANEHFKGSIDLPAGWSVGVIVGPSGTGKTTIAKEVFGDAYVKKFDYTHKSVIDDMPENCDTKSIEKMFYSVGFGSVPSWLKPYSVLSNGEKMRVDLARALLEKDEVVFDEFTSVVDRNVANTACLAIRKALKNTEKKFVAISCHYDILDWIEPDWVFDTGTMQTFFQNARTLKKAIPSEDAGAKSGESLGVITI